MPYLKPIKGHTSCRPVKRYLERGGRDLASDFINLSELHNGKDWAEQMDETRSMWGNDLPHGDKKARTYNHYVLSPNPADNISLEDFREFMLEFLQEAFEDRFEIAVIYHDDNEGRILHAHFIVNNTDVSVDVGKRLAPWLTPKKVREISSICERMAKERGWSNFLEKQDKDTIQLEANEIGKLAQDQDHMFAGISLDESKKEHSPYITNRDAYYTITEREILESGGWSWKEDLRSRIQIARELSTTEEGFLRTLSLLDVKVSTNERGDYRYTHPDSPKWQSNGYRLGQGYSRNGIRMHLADEDLRKIQKPASMQRAEIMEAFDAWRIEGIRSVGSVHPKLNITLADIADAMAVVNQYNIRSMKGFDRVMDGASSTELMRVSAAKGCVQLIAQDVRSMKAHTGRKVTRPELAIEQMTDAEAVSAIKAAREERMKDAPRKPKNTDSRRKKQSHSNAKKQSAIRQNRSGQHKKEKGI